LSFETFLQQSRIVSGLVVLKNSVVELWPFLLSRVLQIDRYVVKSPSKNLLILMMTLLKSKYSKTQKLHCCNASLAIAISLTLAILYHKSILYPKYGSIIGKVNEMKTFGA